MAENPNEKGTEAAGITLPTMILSGPKIIRIDTLHGTLRRPSAQHMKEFHKRI